MATYFVRCAFLIIIVLSLISISAISYTTAAPVTNSNKDPESIQAPTMEYKKYRIALLSLRVMDTHSGKHSEYSAHWHLKFTGSVSPDANGIENTKSVEAPIWGWTKGSEYKLYSKNLTGAVFVDLIIPKSALGIKVSTEGVAVDTGDIVLTEDHVLGKVHNYHPKKFNYGAGYIYGYTSDKGDYHIDYQIIDLSQKEKIQGSKIPPTLAK